MEIYPSMTTIVPEIILISSSDSLEITGYISSLSIKKSINYYWTHCVINLKSKYSDNILEFIQNKNLKDVFVKIKLSLYNQSNQLLELEEYKFEIVQVITDNAFSKSSKEIRMELCVAGFKNLKKVCSFYYEKETSVDNIINDILNKVNIEKSSFVFDGPSSSTKYKNVFIPRNRALDNIAYVINTFGYSDIFTMCIYDHDGFRISNIEKSLNNTDIVLSLMDNSENSIRNFGGYVKDILYKNNPYITSIIQPTILNIITPNIEPENSNDDFYKEEVVDLKKEIKKHPSILKDIGSNYETEHRSLYKYSNNLESVISTCIYSERLIITMIPSKLKQWYIGNSVSVNVVTDYPYYYKGKYIITDVDINIDVSESNQPNTTMILHLGRIIM